MGISSGFKKIAVAWASGVGGQRTDPDDTALTPPLDVATGWPASFSSDGGNTPRRRVVNELYYRRDSALIDIRDHGILPWDVEVDTKQHGIKQHLGVPYRALVANGPSFSNAIAPTADGQTVWERITGTLNPPSAPNQPSAVVGTLELSWSWDCPLDNGAVITSFAFQWREEGANWVDSQIVNVPRPLYRLTGLENGTRYEARVRATNSQGSSGWSPTGSGTPMAVVPAGGNLFALTAVAGDTEVSLDWLEPDTGGAAISAYEVEWRDATQQFSSARRATLSAGTLATEYDKTGLVNGTQYYFRVRAQNSVGYSTYSNEVTATPQAGVPPKPVLSAAVSGNLVTLTWSLPGYTGAVAGHVVRGRTGSDAYSYDDLVLDSASPLVLQRPSGENRFEVLAMNDIGGSEWSDEALATITETYYAGFAQGGGGGSRFQLASLALATGALTAIGSKHTLPGNLSANNFSGVGMAWAGPVLYAALVSAQNNFRLATVNLSTGALTPVGEEQSLTLLFSALNGVSLLHVSGTTYAGFVDQSARKFRVATVNLATGAITSIGSTYDIAGSVGSAPTGVSLLHVSGTTYAGFVDYVGDDFRLATVNLSTGVLTFLGSKVDISTLAGSGINGVSLLHVSGTTYAGFVDAVGDDFRLATVNLSTGALTAIGSKVDISTLVGNTATGVSLFAG